MTTLLLFSLLWMFSFVSTFLTSPIKRILWLKFSTGKRQAEDTVRGKDHRVLCFNHSPRAPLGFERGWNNERLWRTRFINFMIHPPLLRADVITNCRAIELLWVVILKPLRPKVSASGVAFRVQSLSDCSDSKSMNWGSVESGALVQLSLASRPA